MNQHLKDQAEEIIAAFEQYALEVKIVKDNYDFPFGHSGTLQPDKFSLEGTADLELDTKEGVLTCKYKRNLKKHLTGEAKSSKEIVNRYANELNLFVNIMQKYADILVDNQPLFTEQDILIVRFNKQCTPVIRSAHIGSLHVATDKDNRLTVWVGAANSSPDDKNDILVLKNS